MEKEKQRYKNVVNTIKLVSVFAAKFIWLVGGFVVKTCIRTFKFLVLGEVPSSKKKVEYCTKCGQEIGGE